MGLKNGDAGVKLSLRRGFEGAFGRYHSFEDLIEALERTPEETVVCIDGNVMLRQLPSKINREEDDDLPKRFEPLSLKDAVEITIKKLHVVFRAACVVAVVFDEPEIITHAKEAEQKGRDGDRSQGTDDYTLRDMKLAEDLSTLVSGRKGRPRYSDEIFREVRRSMRRFLRKTGKVLVVDGLDERGALRHTGSQRFTAVFGEGDDDVALEVARWLGAYKATGEGDLKLKLVFDRVLAAHGNEDAPELLRDIKLYSTATIDSDEFGVQLLACAERDCAGELDAPVTFLTALYEPSTKRSEEYDGGVATYSVCDIAQLYRLLLSHIFNLRSWRKMKKSTTPLHRREVIALLVASFTMLGCDFVDAAKKLSLRNAVNGVIAFAGTDLLADLRHAWTPDSRNNLRLFTARVLADFLVEDERFRNPNFNGDLSQPLIDSTRQAAWLLSYWSGQEITTDLGDFCLGVETETIVARRALRLRRRTIRCFLMFALLKFGVILHRIRERGIGPRRSIRNSPKRVTAVVAAAPAPAPPSKKRRVIPRPRGNGGWD